MNKNVEKENYIDGLTQDCSNSTANALELLQSCTKPSICLSSRKTIQSVKANSNVYIIRAPLFFATVYNANRIILQWRACCKDYSLKPRRNGRHFADDIFKWIFTNKRVCILIGISLKFVPKRQIGDKSELVQVMACRRKGDKPLPEPMLTWFTMFTDAYICVTTGRWVNSLGPCAALWRQIWLAPKNFVDIVPSGTDFNDFFLKSKRFTKKHAFENAISFHASIYWLR